MVEWSFWKGPQWGPHLPLYLRLLTALPLVHLLQGQGRSTKCPGQSNPSPLHHAQVELRSSHQGFGLAVGAHLLLLPLVFLSLGNLIINVPRVPQENRWSCSLHPPPQCSQGSSSIACTQLCPHGAPAGFQPLAGSWAFITGRDGCDGLQCVGQSDSKSQKLLFQSPVKVEEVSPPKMEVAARAVL